MARGGRVEMTIVSLELARQLEMAIRKVERGTRKATQAAVDEIFENSQKQVPRDTNTLANSGQAMVTGGYRTEFVGEIWYGQPGSINPKSGQEARSYMVQVHEDLSVYHKVGKAKFLEDPIKEYQSRLLGKYSTFIKTELGL